MATLFSGKQTDKLSHLSALERLHLYGLHYVFSRGFRLLRVFLNSHEAMHRFIQLKGVSYAYA